MYTYFRAIILLRTLSWYSGYTVTQCGSYQRCRAGAVSSAGAFRWLTVDSNDAAFMRIFHDVVDSIPTYVNNNTSMTV